MRIACFAFGLCVVLLGVVYCVGDRLLQDCESKNVTDSPDPDRLRSNRSMAITLSHESHEIGVAQASRVVDSQDRPIQQCVIEFREYAASDGELLAQTATDSDGRFCYPAHISKEQLFYVVVSAPGFCTQTWIGNDSIHRSRKGQLVPDTLVLPRPVTIKGRLLCDGQPVPASTLWLDYTFRNGSSKNAITTITDDAGGFEMSGVPPGQIFVRYQKLGPNVGARTRPGVNRDTLAISTFRASDGSSVGSIDLDIAESCCVLEGVLVDRNGDGVPKQHVSVNSAAAAGRLDESLGVMTDADGCFRFERLPPGKFMIGTSGMRECREVELSVSTPVRATITNYYTGLSTLDGDFSAVQWGTADSAGLCAGLRTAWERDELLGDVIRASVFLRNEAGEDRYCEYDFNGNSELQSLSQEQDVLDRFNYLSFSGVPVNAKYLLSPGCGVRLGEFVVQVLEVGCLKSDTRSHFSIIPAKGSDIVALRCVLGGLSSQHNASVARQCVSGVARSVISASNSR